MHKRTVYVTHEGTDFHRFEIVERALPAPTIGAETKVSHAIYSTASLDLRKAREDEHDAVLLAAAKALAPAEVNALATSLGVGARPPVPKGEG